MHDTKYVKETFEMFRELWGDESQYRMCIEEMSELTKALCKFMRYSREEKNSENDKKLESIRQDIIEETADVLICASQIMNIVGEESVQKAINYKIARGRKRAEEDLIKLNGRR